MKKLPKAKCEECLRCRLISKYGDVYCDYLNNDIRTYKHPKRCINFNKGEIKDGADTINIAQKIAEALVKADVDCVKICKGFGGGCYWNCKEKVEHIKQWLVEVIENG